MQQLKYFLWLLLVVFCSSSVFAADKVVVIPLFGSARGNAVPSDVVAGKTFSSSAGEGLTGTLEMPPCALGYTNSIGMTFNLLPAGTFTMGSPPGEPGRDDDETSHSVTLTESFYMQTTEVTNGHWDAVIVDKARGVNPSASHSGEDYPVESVNWYEAASFANWLSWDEGLIPCYDGQGTCTGTLGDNFTCSSVVIVAGCTGYRLTTEAQWEYAARAGTVTAYANPYSFDAGNTETGGGFNSNLHAMGWYEFNNEGGDLSRDAAGYPSGTKPVAQKQANRWGLYDMHGNVHEWCQDWYGSYASGPVIDPQGPDNGAYRVIRGGSWRSVAHRCRSAYRNYSSPGNRGINLGFRLARSVALDP
jgi:formylglycine-generating enzyme required for sulfatase activity